MAIVSPVPLLLTWLKPYVCWICDGVYPEFVGPGPADGEMMKYVGRASGRALSRVRDSSPSTRKVRPRPTAARGRDGRRAVLVLTGVIPGWCDRCVERSGR